MIEVELSLPYQPGYGWPPDQFDLWPEDRLDELTAEAKRAGYKVRQVGPVSVERQLARMENSAEL